MPPSADAPRGRSLQAALRLCVQLCVVGSFFLATGRRRPIQRRNCIASRSRRGPCRPRYCRLLPVPYAVPFAISAGRKLRFTFSGSSAGTGIWSNAVAVSHGGPS